MIAAQRFTVSCSAAFAIAPVRDDIARTMNNFFIGYFCFANAYRNGCIRAQSDMTRHQSWSHKDATAFYVITPSSSLMTLDVKPKQ
jgi:hypothetical protein